MTMELVGSTLGAVFGSLLILLFLFVFRAMFRRLWLAVAALIVLLVVFLAPMTLNIGSVTVTPVPNYIMKHGSDRLAALGIGNVVTLVLNAA
jgi:hypothetical protein